MSRDEAQPSGPRNSGESIQVLGWFVQVIGVVVLCFGIVIALGALPEMDGGRLPESTDLEPFLTLLIAGLGLGFGLMILALIIAVVGRVTARRQLGSSRPVRRILSRLQRVIGMVALGAAAGAFLFTLIPLALQVSL